MKVNNKIFIASRFIAEAASRLVSFIVFPLLTHYLGVEGYGVNAQVGVINGMLIPVATTGLGFSVVRTISGNNDHMRTGQTFLTTIIHVLSTSLILALIVAVAAPLLNILFFKVDWATPVIRWSGILVVTTALEQLFNDYYRARLRILFYSLLQVGQVVLYSISIYLVLAAQGTLLQVIWIAAGIKFFTILILFVYYALAEKISMANGLLPKIEYFRMVRFGLPIVVMGIGLWLVSVGDRLLIGYFLSSREVGIYNGAYTLAGILVALAAPFWGPLYPLMAHHKNQEDRAGLVSVCRRYTSAYFLIALPSLIGLIILSPRLIILLGSSEFSVSPIVFAMIGLGLFLDQFSVNAHYLIYLHDDPAFLRNVMIAGGVFNILLNIAVVPIMGIRGAAGATLLTYILLTITLFRRLRRYGFTMWELYDFSTTGKYLLSSLGMGGIILLTGSQDTGWLAIGRSVLVGVLAYGFLVWMFHGFRRLRVWHE